MSNEKNFVSWNLEMVTIEKPTPAMHNLMDLLATLSEKIYEQRGRHELIEIGVTLEYGLDLGIPPGHQVDISLPCGQITITACPVRTPR